MFKPGAVEGAIAKKILEQEEANKANESGGLESLLGGLGGGTPETMIAGMILNKVQGDKQKMDGIKNQALGGVGSMIGLAGGAMSMAANSPDDAPDVGLSALGGGLTGFATGLESGGLLKGLLGGGLGAFTSFMGTGLNRQDFEESEIDSVLGLLQGSKVLPDVGYAEEGGLVALGMYDEVVPVQAEKGEKVMLSDFGITDVKSRKKHEDMDKDEVTDVLPMGAFVFTDSDKYLISKAAAEKYDDILGYKPMWYEDGDKTFKDSETAIKFSSLYRKGEEELSAAELAHRIKLKFKTTSLENDIFAEAANNENKTSRAPYLGKLIELQLRMTSDSKGGSIEEATIKTTDGGDVQIMATGGVAGEPTREEIEKLLEGVDNIQDQINILRSVKRPIENIETTTKNNLINPVTDPIGAMKQSFRGLEGEDILNALTSGELGLDQLNFLKNLDIPLGESNIEDILELVQGYSNTPGSEQILADYINKDDIDKTFRGLDNEINRLDELNKANQEKQKERMGTLFQKLRGKNALGLASKTFGNLMQSNREDAAYRDISGVNAMFQDVPEDVIRNQEQQLSRSMTSNMRQMIDSGMSPTQTASQMGGLSANMINSMNNIRGQYELAKIENRGKRAQYIQQARDFNEGARVQAENARRNNQNQSLRDLSLGFNEFLRDSAKLDAQKQAYENRIESEFNKNAQNLFQNRLNTEGNRIGALSGLQANERRAQYLKDYYDGRAAGAATGPSVVSNPAKPELERTSNPTERATEQLPSTNIDLLDTSLMGNPNEINLGELPQLGLPTIFDELDINKDRKIFRR